MGLQPQDLLREFERLGDLRIFEGKEEEATGE